MGRRKYCEVEIERLRCGGIEIPSIDSWIAPVSRPESAKDDTGHIVPHPACSTGLVPCMFCWYCNLPDVISSLYPTASPIGNVVIILLSTPQSWGSVRGAY